MSDEQPPGSEAHGHSEATGPGRDAPPTPRPRRMALLLAIAVVSLLALAAIVVQVVAPAVRMQEASNLKAVDTKGLERVGWAGGGRFAVVQDFDRDGTPVVSAWDRETGRLKEQRGWLWLRTEQAAPALWMIPMSAEQVATLVDAPGQTPYPLSDVGLKDAPAPGLARWTLDADGAPAPALSWTPIPNGQGVSVELGVDPAKGSAPSSMRFRQPDGSVVDAKDRPSGSTFEPMGWSASGKRFAVNVFGTWGMMKAGNGRTEFFMPDGTSRGSASSTSSVSTMSWAGSDTFLVTAVSAGVPTYPVTAQDLTQPVPRSDAALAEISRAEGPPALLGPAGQWVLIGVNAKRGARQYDEITAPGQRKRVLLIGQDPTAEWTQEAWQEGAGLLRLGVAVSATGQARTRVVLYRPGLSRPKTVYKGPKRLVARGKR